MENIDQIDTQILTYLRKDGRMSFAEIAEHIERTEATIRRRVKKMEETGIIDRFTVITPNKKLKVIIKISPDLKHIKEITRELLKIEQITDIWRLSGDCGLFIRVEIPSIENLDPLVEEKISPIIGVDIRETCIVTREIKSKLG